MALAQYKAQHPDRVYLDTPFHEKDAAKAVGARWDTDCPRGNGSGKNGKWYVPPELAHDLTAFKKWLPADHAQHEPAGPVINEWGYEDYESWKDGYVAEAKQKSAARGRGVGWCFLEEELGECAMADAGMCKWKHSRSGPPSMFGRFLPTGGRASAC